MECLVTGIKGFGKTAHALDLVFVQASEFAGMDVYSEGIAYTEAGHLRLPHFDFPLLSDIKKSDYIPLCTVDADGTDDADYEESAKYKPWLPSHFQYAEFLEARAVAKHPIELWFLWAQKNSVILIDEAQRFYRPRPSGAKVPLHIQMIEYARHFGIHFVFISQAPRFMDINVRAHVEKHIHLDKTWKGGLKFEAVGVMDIESKSDRKDAVKSSYSPPKHIWPLYVSSSLHLKVKHKIPFAFKALFVIVPLFIFLGFYIVHKVKQDHLAKNPGAALPQSPAPGFVADGSLVGASGVSAPGQFSEGKVKKYLADFVPVVPGLPESAPAYDSVRKIAAMPRVAGCVASSHACLCYSQQGGRLPEVTEARCRQLLTGFGFDPYKIPEKSISSKIDQRPIIAASNDSPVRLVLPSDTPPAPHLSLPVSRF